MSDLVDRVASRFAASVSKEDVEESVEAKKTIHEWSSELSSFADGIEKFDAKVGRWRDKLPEADVQAKHYERVEDDLMEAQAVLVKAMEKLRKLAHDLGG